MTLGEAICPPSLSFPPSARATAASLAQPASPGTNKETDAAARALRVERGLLRGGALLGPREEPARCRWRPVGTGRSRAEGGCGVGARRLPGPVWVATSVSVTPGPASLPSSFPPSHVTETVTRRCLLSSRRLCKRCPRVQPPAGQSGHRARGGGEAAPTVRSGPSVPGVGRVRGRGPSRVRCLMGSELFLRHLPVYGFAFTWGPGVPLGEGLLGPRVVQPVRARVASPGTRRRLEESVPRASPG